MDHLLVLSYAILAADCHRREAHRRVLRVPGLMPHWDFKCDACGRVDDIPFRSHRDLERLIADGKWISCGRNGCTGAMQRMPSAPNFKIEFATEVGHQKVMGFDVETRRREDAYIE